jgi:hypothetical protein
MLRLLCHATTRQSHVAMNPSVLALGPRFFAVKRARPPPELFSDADVTEQFVRGGGAGGQAVARTANCVVLRHAPTGITVRCHATRSREQNRSRARRILAEKIDELRNGDSSVRAQARDRARRKSSKARSRARKKYGAAPTLPPRALLPLRAQRVRLQLSGSSRYRSSFCRGLLTFKPRISSSRPQPARLWARSKRILR